MCGKRFGAKCYLTYHLLFHIKPFACDVCGKRFACKWELTRHLHIHKG
ncbi:unnamed protein product [Larinioides sclopetarius]